MSGITELKSLWKLNAVINYVCLPFVYIEIHLESCNGTQKYVLHEPVLKQLEKQVVTSFVWESAVSKNLLSR